jgi:hypothetical protein
VDKEVDTTPSVSHSLKETEEMVKANSAGLREAEAIRNTGKN